VDLPLLADTWVHAGTPDTNYDGYAALVLFTTGLDNALLSFDRSALPTNATILDADLTVFVTFESGATGKRLTALNVENFDPTSVTFADHPTYFNPGPDQFLPPEPGEMHLTVADQVTNWDQLPVPTLDGKPLGQLALAVSGPYAGRVALASLESWPPGRHARLRVTYLP
ncbi:MAG: DNRLRE domain-containing protein, partial [Caldilineae bacterium]